MQTDNDAGFGLYIHWPFCQSKCPYCDFNSHVAERVDQSRWLRAYQSEIARAGNETSGRRLRTVFFGGGTPSLMAPETVHGILDCVRSTWSISNDWEVTLEANPGSVEAGKFRDFRSAGVNRLSMGIQALNDADLKRLGRLHSAAEAMAAFDIARECFDRVSFDLIYARQDQEPSAWAEELSRALRLGLDHLSLYQLTIEDGTAFGDRFARGGLAGLPDEDRSVALYEITQDLCEAVGLPAYEVSNHAQPERQSQHNLIYWRGGDYVGIGPGAHGRLTLGEYRYATESFRQPGGWLAAVEQTQTGESLREALSSQAHALEYLLMSMRLSEGMDRARFETLARQTFSSSVLAELQDLALIISTESRISATPRGRMVLNAVIRKLSDGFQA